MNICPRTNRHCEITGCNGNNQSCQHQIINHVVQLSPSVTIRHHTETDIVNEFARRMKSVVAIRGTVREYDVDYVLKAVKDHFGLP